MTALERALHVADEPSAWPGWRLAAVAVVTWLVIAVVMSRVFALGGFRSPTLIVGSLLALPAALLAWGLAATERHRTWITALAMMVAVALLPLATHGATPSTGRLAEIADGLQLPGVVARDHRLGNGRCRNACSEIRRVAFVDEEPEAAVEFRITSTLKKRGYQVTLYPHAPLTPQRIDAKRGKILVSIEIRIISVTRTRIAEIFLTEGPAPDTSVG